MEKIYFNICLVAPKSTQTQAQQHIHKNTCSTAYNNNKKNEQCRTNKSKKIERERGEKENI